MASQIESALEKRGGTLKATSAIRSLQDNLRNTISRTGNVSM